jgi:flagella basal body P-ring formation protein FlgA
MTNLRIFYTILFCLLPATAYSLAISISPSAEVSTEFVRLGDVATFSDDSAIATALASQRLCNAPAIDSSVTIKTGTIQTKIQRSSDLKEEIKWIGSPETVVTRKSVSINADDMLESIDEYIFQQKETLPPAEYSFVPRQLPIPFKIPTGDLEIRIVPSNPEIIGSTRFALIYKVNGTIVKNLSIRGKLKAMAPVAVMSQSVRKGAILHPEMVTMKEQDLSTLRTPCTNLRMVLGKKLTKRLQVGTVLDLSFIEFPPVIHKGQLVKMVINHKGIQLVATGIASTNGKQDQIIRVMNTRSDKSVFCKVSSPGIVEVQL